MARQTDGRMNRAAKARIFPVRVVVTDGRNANKAIRRIVRPIRTYRITTGPLTISPFSSYRGSHAELQSRASASILARSCGIVSIIAGESRRVAGLRWGGLEKRHADAWSRPA